MTNTSYELMLVAGAYQPVERGPRLAQPARLELLLRDPQLRTHFRIIGTHLLIEPLSILAPDEQLELGKSGERASSTTA